MLPAKWICTLVQCCLLRGPVPFSRAMEPSTGSVCMGLHMKLCTELHMGLHGMEPYMGLYMELCVEPSMELYMLDLMFHCIFH